MNQKNSENRKLFDCRNMFDGKWTVRRIIYLAMLTAIEVALTRICTILNTDIMKINVAFVPVMMAAFLYGPADAAIVNALSDFVGALLFPTGAYFPGFTITAALVGLIWGLFLYKRRIDEAYYVLNVAVPSLLTNLGVGLLINTWMIAQFFSSKTYGALVAARLVEYAIMIPLNLLLAPFVKRLCDQLKKYVLR